MRDQFVWVVEDFLAVGTLQQYADDRADGYYSGLYVSDHVWSLRGQQHLDKVRPDVSHVYEAGDFRLTDIAVSTDPDDVTITATIRIDLRA